VTTLRMLWTLALDLMLTGRCEPSALWDAGW